MHNKILQVFPTNRSIRKNISLKLRNNQLLEKKITIGDFFSNVILAKKNKTYVDKDMRIVILQEAIRNIDIKPLGLEKNFAKLFNSSEYIFKFFKELSSEFKTIDDIFSVDIYEFYEEHLKILKKIYRSYKKLIDKYGFVDSIFLPEEYELNLNYLKNFNEIEFFLEGYLSSYEFNILNEVASYNRLTLHLTINRFNHKSKDKFAFFGFKLENNYSYHLDITEHKILFSSPIKLTESSHIIYPVTERIQQIAVVKKAISDMVLKGIEAEDIAVILPDENFSSYIKLFDDENYFNFAMGLDIFSSAFYRKLKILYDSFFHEEPKYKEKLYFEGIDLDFISTNVVPFIHQKLDKEHFFMLYDYMMSFEKNSMLKEKLLELRITLENILFHESIQEGTILLKDALKILLQKLGQISLDDVKSGKITVLGVLESRHVTFKGVVVIDFNDDKVPKRSVKDKFFSTAIKGQVGLPTPFDRQNLQKYYFSRLFGGAENIVLSFVQNDENAMSRFISEIFQKPHIVYEDFGDILGYLEPKYHYSKDITQQIDLSTLKWSASRLKDYLTCKRKFYFKVILKLKEHNVSIEPKPYETGQIIHEVLEKCYKEKKYSGEDINQTITQYQNKNPYLTFELELWKQNLDKFYQYEQKRFENKIQIFKLEEDFEVNFEGIILVGRIDRIDIEDNRYSILDYKTSAKLRIDTIKSYETSNDFQLEFYYLAMREYDINYVGYYDLREGKIKKATVLDEKLEILKKHLRKLRTENVSFEKCVDDKECKNCPYKIICNR